MQKDTSCSVTPEQAAALDADALVVSTGATAKIPPIPGVCNANVMTAVDVLLKKAPVGQNVVVIGGGQVGCEVGRKI